ncbi:hypothetical protein WKI68_42555 [Streptomyces sp. MS1.HAVA.3]|uniref:Uncharacterized protein n=1 Tax=Streptomyces caledonius TaxID=3134107 RepID=A0ABU8UG54_9ACTN
MNINRLARRMVTVAALASAPFALIGTAHAADTPAGVDSVVTADDQTDLLHGGHNDGQKKNHGKGKGDSGDLVESLTDTLLGEKRGSCEEGVDADVDLLDGDEVAEIEAENDGRRTTGTE